MKYTALVTLTTTCLLGCGGTVNEGTQREEQQATEAQQQVHLKASPPPKLARSQERINLTKRLERFNTDSKVSYIYLISFGKVMAFHTVKGKVSSVNSLLTTPEQVVDHKLRGTAHVEYSSHVVASPDLDGSYGSNGDAIFFFTTDDTYVEWAGHYMLCDKPLKLSTPPELVIQVKD